MKAWRLYALAAALGAMVAACGAVYQAGTEYRALRMRDSLKVGESVHQVRERFGEPDIRRDVDQDTEVWSYAQRANTNDVAATVFYTAAKPGDRGQFLDLTFVGRKLQSWSEATHTVPSKQGGGFSYGIGASPAGGGVTHY